CASLLNPYSDSW
nr:immunoglobulin heavy chain junction region [Macaca mulatta]MOW79335.1 immunoglobulin heavy chain junction region [Macaca mulatta]MOW80546.1 immunoglobulin heavy chain junction region [Macaca mulatta]